MRPVDINAGDSSTNRVAGSVPDVSQYGTDVGWTIEEDGEEWSFDMLSDPDNASGLCVAAAEQFTEWVNQNGGSAETVDGRGPDFYPGVPDIAHTVTVVNGDTIYDWTASQFGFEEFPKVTRKPSK